MIHKSSLTFSTGHKRSSFADFEDFLSRYQLARLSTVSRGWLCAFSFDQFCKLKGDDGMSSACTAPPPFYFILFRVFRIIPSSYDVPTKLGQSHTATRINFKDGFLNVGKRLTKRLNISRHLFYTVPDG